MNGGFAETQEKLGQHWPETYSILQTAPSGGEGQVF